MAIYDYTMGVYEAEDLFEQAQKSGMRYVAIIDQPVRWRSLLKNESEAIITNDPMEIIRLLRSKGLRPNMHRATIKKVFDVTDKLAFIYQYQRPPAVAIAKYLPQEAQDAHARYLEARAKMDAPPPPKKSGFGRFFGG